MKQLLGNESNNNGNKNKSGIGSINDNNKQK